MAYGDKHPYKGDLKKLDTRGTARRTSQESIDAARVQASGRDSSPPSPELQAWAKAEVEDRVKRTVRGVFEHKGRAPMFTLSHAQFAEHVATGSWSGEPRMPTPEEYGPRNYTPEDKEYTRLPRYG